MRVYCAASGITHPVRQVWPWMAGTVPLRLSDACRSQRADGSAIHGHERVARRGKRASQVSDADAMTHCRQVGALDGLEQGSDGIRLVQMCMAHAHVAGAVNLLFRPGLSSNIKLDTELDQVDLGSYWTFPSDRHTQVRTDQQACFPHHTLRVLTASRPATPVLVHCDQSNAVQPTISAARRAAVLDRVTPHSHVTTTDVRGPRRRE